MFLGHLKISFVDDDSSAGTLTPRARTIKVVPGDLVRTSKTRGAGTSGGTPHGKQSISQDSSSDSIQQLALWPSLLSEYETFQRYSKTFIDSKPPQATVVACDSLLRRASSLDTRAKALLNSTNAKVKSLKVKIKTLSDRSKTITNQRIKDRLETLIEDLKKEIQLNEQKHQEWIARGKELLKAKKDLDDYRIILEVIESK